MSIMVDIETLGTRPGSAIVAIGAVRFHPKDSDHLYDEFYATINLDQPPMSVDSDTIKWWLRQSDAARLATFADNPTHTLGDALAALARFYRPQEEVWAHGSAFDVVLLEEAYRRYGIPIPWHHRDIRDTRTIYALRPDIQPLFEGMKHNALDDAKHQARWLQRVFGCIRT